MGKTQENIIISYSGKLNYEIINELLEDLNDQMKNSDLTTLCRKRVYSTAVESLENILRHAKQTSDKHLPRFAVKENSDSIMIETCNLVSMDQRNELQEKIEYINANNNRLKQVFAEKLRNSHISKEGGAGLGVYIIGKNAGRKIAYSFDRVNEKESYFCLKIKILQHG